MDARTVRWVGKRSTLCDRSFVVKLLNNISIAARPACSPEPLTVVSGGDVNDAPEIVDHNRSR